MQSMEKLLYLYCKIIKLKRICSGLTLMHVCGYVIRVTHVYSDRLSQHIHMLISCACLSQDLCSKSFISDVNFPKRAWNIYYAPWKMDPCWGPNRGTNTPRDEVAHLTLLQTVMWLYDPIRGSWQRREPIRGGTLICRSGIALIFNQREFCKKVQPDWRRFVNARAWKSLRERQKFSLLKSINIEQLYMYVDFGSCKLKLKYEFLNVNFSI